MQVLLRQDMRALFPGYDQYTVAEINIDETQVHGSGGAASPVLNMPIKLDVFHPELRPHDGLQFTSLKARLTAESLLVSVSEEERMHLILQKQFSQIKDSSRYFAFPLDRGRVDALERRRNGGDLKLQMEAILSVNRLHALNEPKNERRVETVWGHVQGHSLQLRVDLTIPRDTWISRVLPHVGYGVVHVLEFSPAPIETCAVYEHAFKALQQAQSLHREGRYDDAVAKCRVALDKFFDQEPVNPTVPNSRTIPVLKKTWAEKSGKTLYDFLNGTFGAIKSAANRSHHSPNAHYDHFESQMLIAMTTTVVAFAARTAEVDSKTDG